MPKQPVDTWIIDTLEAIKAVDITVLDVQHLTAMTDAMVVCTGTSSTHVKAIGNRLVEASKDHELRPIGIEGIEQGEWVLIDLDHVVVHIMQADTRALYAIEKLWDFTEASRQS
jgi:ribosome-associated protein